MRYKTTLNNEQQGLQGAKHHELVQQSSQVLGLIVQHIQSRAMQLKASKAKGKRRKGLKLMFVVARINSTTKIVLSCNKVKSTR